MMAILAMLAFLIFQSPAGASTADYEKTLVKGDSFYTAEEITKAKYETDLFFVLFPETGWTEDLVRSHLSGFAKVYLQCGVKISNVVIFVPSQLRLPAKLSKYKMDDPTSILKLAEKTADLPHPLIHLVGDFSDSGATPFSRATFVDMTSPIPSALENTLWFSMFVNSAEYIEERKNSPSSVLAHELTHIFTRDGDHNNDVIPNLMTIYWRRTDLLTPQLCQEILKSKFIKAL
jgi:hypothetical protein